MNSRLGAPRHRDHYATADPYVFFSSGNMFYVEGLFTRETEELRGEFPMNIRVCGNGCVPLAIVVTFLSWANHNV